MDGDDDIKPDLSGSGDPPTFESTLIPNGFYVVRYVRYETRRFHGSQGKVYAYFAVVEHDEYAGSGLERFYNVEKLNGALGANGEFTALERGDLYREVSNLLGYRPRRDRIPMSKLKGMRIRAEVGTVTKNRKGDDLPQCHHYNRIVRLIEALPDNDWSV